MATFWIFICVLYCSLAAAQDEIIFPTDPPLGTESRWNSDRCFTPDRIAGQCIRLGDCKPLYELLKTPHIAPRDRMILKHSQCGWRHRDVLVCCPETTKVTPMPPVEPSKGANLLPSPGVCGSSASDRIYGGNITEIDEFPWMALLEYTKPGNQKSFNCGGVLINNRYVLTASHCVNGRSIPSDWRLTGVRLGEWDLSTEKDCDEDLCNDPPVDVSIEESIPHENYQPNSRNQFDDVALLRLSRDVPYTDWIKPVCLPTAEHLQGASYDGQNLDVAGWGRTETGKSSQVKLRARVDGVNLNSCNETFKSRGVTLKETQICAGGEEGIDSCSGDSGGPLVGLDRTMPARPYFYLVGVVSYGLTKCGTEGFPGIYTRASHYVDWIQRKIRP